MEARILINGPIGASEERPGVTLASVISQVKAQPEATSLAVEIDSPGGNLQVGFDIFNYLKSTGLPIKTIGKGMVASVATVVFMAGTTRVLQQGTLFMIHLPSLPGGAGGTAEDISLLAKEMKKVEDRVVKFYQDHIQIDKETIHNLLKTESFLNETEAFNLGFTTTAEPLQAVALLEVSKPSKNKPKNNKDMKDPKKAKGLLAKLGQMIAGFLDGAEMLIVYTADQQEINFPDLPEGSAPEVGATATIDGENANGTFTDADGNELVFEDGILTAWNEASSDDPSDDDETIEEMQQRFEALTKDLDIANAKIVDLTENLSKAQAEVKDKANELKTANKEVEQARAAVMEIKKVHSELVGEIGGAAPSAPSRNKKPQPGTAKKKAKAAMAQYRKQRASA